jgi:hypothetical protein
MASGAAGASPLAWRYGGFWIRFGARFIDGLIFTVPILIFAAVLIPNLIRAGRQAGNPASVPNPAFAGFGFITFFLAFFLLGGCQANSPVRHVCAGWLVRPPKTFFVRHAFTAVCSSTTRTPRRSFTQRMKQAARMAQARGRDFGDGRGWRVRSHSFVWFR